MTELQLCNMALRRINAEPITDLETDTTKSAALCRTFYDNARDAVLEDHPWSFSISRQLLAISATTNLSTWLYVYQIPTDPKCVRPLSLLDSVDFYREAQYPFRVEGQDIYTDLASAGLKYIFQQTDPTKFSPMFCDALAWRLSAELIKPVEGTSPVDPWMMYRDVLLTAQANDDMGKQEPDLPPQLWTETRFG